MQKHDATTFASGAITAMHDFIGHGYAEAALKGIIGGAFGYAGKLIVTSIYTYFKNRNKTTNQNQ